MECGFRLAPFAHLRKRRDCALAVADPREFKNRESLSVGSLASTRLLSQHCPAGDHQEETRSSNDVGKQGHPSRWHRLVHEGMSTPKLLAKTLAQAQSEQRDRKSTRLNSSHV